MPLLKRSGCVISTLPIKTLALAVVLVFLLTESEVTVMQRPGLKVSILVWYQKPQIINCEETRNNVLTKEVRERAREAGAEGGI